MGADEFITSAIERGQSVDLGMLTPDERFVFLIWEAEVYGDMEGIDSLIDRYAPADLLECASAFAEVGGKEIALQLRRIVTSLPTPEESTMARANDLIRVREGYGYDTIRIAVERRRTSGG